MSEWRRHSVFLICTALRMVDSEGRIFYGCNALRASLASGLVEYFRSSAKHWEDATPSKDAGNPRTSVKELVVDLDREHTTIHGWLWAYEYLRKEGSMHCFSDVIRRIWPSFLCRHLRIRMRLEMVWRERCRTRTEQILHCSFSGTYSRMASLGMSILYSNFFRRWLRFQFKNIKLRDLNSVFGEFCVKYWMRRVKKLSPVSRLCKSYEHRILIEIEEREKE